MRDETSVGRMLARLDAIADDHQDERLFLARDVLWWVWDHKSSDSTIMRYFTYDGETMT